MTRIEVNTSEKEHTARPTHSCWKSVCKEISLVLDSHSLLASHEAAFASLHLTLLPCLWQVTEAVYFNSAFSRRVLSSTLHCESVHKPWSGGISQYYPSVRDMMCKENLWWFKKANIGLKSWENCEDGLAASWGWWRILVCLWNSPGTWLSAINTWNLERYTVGPESSVAG